MEEMTYQEIQQNKEKFLSQYNVENSFYESKFSWDELMRIGKDFEEKSAEGGEYFQIIQRYIAHISTFESVHSYRYRIKKVGSLLGKILRKSTEKQEKITIDNYFREITDLLGIRILYVFKEDYWPVHLQIMREYKEQLVEDIRLKLKDGDDEETYASLLKGYSNVKVEKNKMYRSIHYTINADTTDILKGPKLEIQTRTIFEEGWSEINHKLVYKKGAYINPSLNKTSGALSGLVGTCDTIGGLMKDIYDAGVDPESTKAARDAASPEDSLGEAIKKFLCQ